MDFIIRQAVETDAHAISGLVTGWAHHYLEDPDLPEASSFLASLTPASTAERIATGEFKYYVALDDLGVCGVIAIRDTSHLYHLFVRGDAHGRGIARALWEHAKALSGSTRFIVNSSLPAVPVYERFGFVAKDTPQSARGLTFVPMAYDEAADSACAPTALGGLA
ncbi:GNAT family N-acetyltransferase [Montanilutibacter psychrotolerans]|uniref:GNAT family N-acetyltransferase n=1 Tax=Montanilutibacter psychrotolerans TaxID=1327343 RepID=A0A3M8SY34_9GAMM|nr:GNAT family N-acetyltransferase [Lysobacter psychrotolerans]RNF84164.1 GNAT family N-acetyltransferase [Lysobacter psychrotolerans]